MTFDGPPCGCNPLSGGGVGGEPQDSGRRHTIGFAMSPALNPTKEAKEIFS